MTSSSRYGLCPCDTAAALLSGSGAANFSVSNSTQPVCCTQDNECEQYQSPCFVRSSPSGEILMYVSASDYRDVIHQDATVQLVITRHVPTAEVDVPTDILHLTGTAVAPPPWLVAPEPVVGSPEVPSPAGSDDDASTPPHEPAWFIPDNIVLHTVGACVRLAPHAVLRGEPDPLAFEQFDIADAIHTEFGNQLLPLTLATCTAEPGTRDFLGEVGVRAQVASVDQYGLTVICHNFVEAMFSRIPFERPAASKAAVLRTLSALFLCRTKPEPTAAATMRIPPHSLVNEESRRP